jgi:coenzyme Q-binding protein COQ10
MKQLYEKRHLHHHSMQHLFKLVLDISSYPSFLPWVTNATIIASTPGQMTADLTVRFASLTQSYRSNVTYEYTNDKAYIEAESHTGPFKHLFSRWDITQDGTDTIIEFLLEFELKSKLMTNLVGPVIMEAQKKMIAAFEKRAGVISCK